MKTLSVPYEDPPEYKEALLAWCRYRVACEEYDRTLWSAYFRHKDSDTVVHADLEDRKRSGRYALAMAGRYLGFLNHELSQRAKRETACWSYARCVEYVKARKP